MSSPPSRPLPLLPELSLGIHLTILTLVTLLLFLSGTSSLPLIDRDEPRFAQAAREMIQRVDPFIPTFNGEYRFDKPPLIYWMMAPFYGLFGASELTARLPAILSSLVLVLITYGIGRQFFNPTTGFFAAFTLATSLQLQIHGRLAVADLPMILSVTVSQGLLLWRLTTQPDNKSDWPWFWAFYLTLALGFLAKGPIVLAVTMLTLLLYRFVLWRKPLAWKQLRLGLGTVLILGVIGLWGIPALVKTHGLLWKVGMGEHVVARGMESFDGRPHFVPYYLFTSLLSLCPWAALLGYAWVALRRQWDEKCAFLCSWALAPYLIFTLYSTQLPHYVMPAFPALFLLIGLAGNLSTEASLPCGARWWARGCIGFYGLLCLVILGLILSLDRSESVTPLRETLLSLWGVLCGLLFLVLFYFSGQLRRMGFAIGLIALSLLFLGHSLRSQAPALQVQSLAKSLSPQTLCLARGYSEPSLVFYTDRRWKLDQSLEEIKSAMTTPGPRLVVLLVEERSLDRALKGVICRLRHQPLPDSSTEWSRELEQLSLANAHVTEFTGLNMARASWVRIAVVYRP